MSELSSSTCCDKTTTGDKEFPTLEELAKVLVDETAPAAKRTRAVFVLRHMGTEEAMDVLATALKSPSVLLGHEVAYVLGQMKSKYPTEILRKVLKSDEYHLIVRHEAAEALGAIGLEDNIDILEEMSKDKNVEIAHTCQIALDRLKFIKANPNFFNEYKSDYECIDPAPPCEETSIKKLQEQLMNKSLSLFERYRAMFKLRDINTKEAIQALATGFADDSPVFRHEIAFVFGQLGNPHSVPSLVEMLKKDDEHSMVRHEAAEALGSVGTDEAVEVIKEFQKDKDRIVKESCEVALDIYDYWNLGIEGGCC